MGSLHLGSLMEDQIFAFIAGGVAGCILMFVFLLMLGVAGSDPDSW